MHSPRALLAILTHEEGHYIGDGRLRNKRVDAYVKVAIIILLETLLPEEKIEKILFNTELTEEEQDLLWDDWVIRKKELYSTFFQWIQKEIKICNQCRKSKYHFDDLYNEVCRVIKQDILYDRKNEVLMYMNTISDKLRNYMNRKADCGQVIQVLDSERRILEEGILEALLSEKLFDDLEEIKAVWREIYSDFLAVELLQLEPISYLETYLLSESYQLDKSMINSLLINRVAIVRRIVGNKWDEEWNRATLEKCGDNFFLWNLKQEVDVYLSKFDNATSGEEKNSRIISLPNSGFQEDVRFDPFLRRNIVEIEIEYLSETYKAVKQTINREKVAKNLKLIRRVYRHFKVYEKGEEPGYNEFFEDIDCMIADYKESVRAEWKRNFLTTL